MQNDKSSLSFDHKMTLRTHTVNFDREMKTFNVTSSQTPLDRVVTSKHIFEWFTKNSNMLLDLVSSYHASLPSELFQQNHIVTITTDQNVTKASGVSSSSAAICACIVQCPY